MKATYAHKLQALRKYVRSGKLHKKLKAESSLAPASGSAYRLVNALDTILQTDERLCDDCETWEAFEANNPHVGKKYNGNIFVPMRRKQPQKGQGMKMSKASDKEWQALVDYFNDMENRDEAVPQWRRVVFGFRVVVDNACDPNASTLEFKPEIGEAMAERDQALKQCAAWHAMARELELALANDGIEPNNPLSDMARKSAISRFNAMEEKLK